jgi:hypothetical protein
VSALTNPRSVASCTPVVTTQVAMFVSSGCDRRESSGWARTCRAEEWRGVGLDEYAGVAFRYDNGLGTMIESSADDDWGEARDRTQRLPDG